MATESSSQDLTDESSKSRAEDKKKLIEELKVQWKLLWSERFNDKVKAEGISVKDYLVLHVERGTIIHATRDFKALSFREIVEQHIVENPDRFVQPDVNVGGWNKFIKKEITSHKPKKSERVASYTAAKSLDKHAGQQPKKGGRGWLHST